MDIQASESEKYDFIIRIAENKHLIIDYFDPKTDSIETTFWHNPNLIAILINTKSKLKRHEIEKRLVSAQNLFTDNYKLFSNHIITDSKDPVLIIDDQPIHHASASKIINQLSSKEIKNISVVAHAPSSLYGRNAKNGVVRIWTKK